MAQQVSVEGLISNNTSSVEGNMYIKESSSTESPWYHSEIGNRLKPPVRKVFEDYAKVPSVEVDNHISKIRDKAWDIRPYPCVGEYSFLRSIISSEPISKDIITKLKSGATILDIGSCFGQELRFLAARGAPTENMYATDLVSDFWPLGHELFQDKEKFHATFIEADFLADPSEANEPGNTSAVGNKHGLEDLKGRVDIAHAGAFLHLFDWDNQARASRRIVSLSKPGTIFVGYQMGNNPAREIQTGWGNNGGSKVFFHDKESFEKMWEEVGRTTGTKWKVEVEERPFDAMVEKGDFGWVVDTACVIVFVVTREK